MKETLFVILLSASIVFVIMTLGYQLGLAKKEKETALKATTGEQQCLFYYHKVAKIADECLTKLEEGK